MTIQYVGGQTASITASTATNTTITFALTGGLASTPAADDLVIVSYSIGSTVARTPAINTAGYTQLTALAAADTFDANLRLGYKLMGVTPDTSVVVGPTLNTADSGFVTIHVFRGVDPTTPLDGVTPVTATANNSGTPNPGAITPATANNVIYVVGANGHGTTGTMTASYATAFLTGQNIATTNRTTMGAGYVTGQAAGVSYDPAAFTWSANINTQAWCAYTIVLRDYIPPTGVTVDVAGVSATGATGSITQTGDASVPVIGTDAVGDVGSVGVFSPAYTPAWGIIAGAPIADDRASTDVSVVVNLAGVSAAAAPGTLTVSADATVPLTGVSGSAFSGAVVAVGDANVPVTGVAAAGAVGTVVAGSAVSAVLTGVSATASPGTVTVRASAIVPVTGVAGAGQVGSVAVTLRQVVLVTGVQSTGQVGQLLAYSGLLVPVTGVAASGAAGVVTVRAGARHTVTGVSAVGLPGTVIAAAGARVTPTTVVASGQLGQFNATGDALFTITGAQGLGAVGQATGLSRATCNLVGLQARGFVGGVLVWGNIAPGTAPGFTPIGPPMDVVWGVIAPNTVCDYVIISNGAASDWQTIDPMTDPQWDIVPT